MLADEAAVAEFVRSNEVAIVGVMEKEGSEAHLKLKEAAEADFGQAYGITFDDKVRGRHDRHPSKIAVPSLKERQCLAHVCPSLQGRRLLLVQ